MSSKCALITVVLLASCGGAAVEQAGPAAGATSSSSASSGEGGASVTSTSMSATTSSGAGGASADRVIGVTLTAVDDVLAIVDSLSSLSKRPTARVVFDETEPPSSYTAAVPQIHAVAGVMGEILDSFYVWQVDPKGYMDRTTQYLDALGADVDVWEVGNEINGEWLCGQNAMSCTQSETADVVAKMTGAYDLVKQRGGKTALTLYYNEGCYSQPENEMFTWASANVPPDMRAGLDWVLISYYEDDCNDLEPDWATVFSKLGQMFPSASLGMGECGTTDPAKKAMFVDRYYRMKIDHPRFIGGDFWWYFRDDMVPKSSPLWTVLNDAISAP